MDLDNLRTASLYINNVLLARGLLRDGQNIDFARPHKAEEGLSTTMGRIMTIINDLVIRRDRDAAQRESLSQTIRAMRADALRQTAEIERLQSKYGEAQRRIGSADAAERSFKSQIRSAEHNAKVLKEEVARMKTLANQTRAQCANDVRKRERTIDGLKKHVGEGGRPRGTAKNPGFATVHVTAGVGKEQNPASNPSTEEAGYNLRMETNAFLSELARGLSEENDHLGLLVRRTVNTLQIISGCEKSVAQDGGMVVDMEQSYESLAVEMDEVIDHLRTLLTNPSFVPLEEVEMREEEIMRLREGWEKMESRWKEAVLMMDGWRKRMARSGQSVDIEELKMGLSLSPIRLPSANDALHDIEEEDEEIQDVNDASDFESDSDDTDSLAEPPADELEVDPELASEAPELQEDRLFSSVSSLGSLPQLTPLRETKNSQNRGGFTTIIEENTFDLLQHDAVPPVAPSPEKKAETKLSMPPSTTSAPLVTYPELDETKKPRFSPAKPARPAMDAKPVLREPSGSSRLPRPAATQPPQSPLTMTSIAAKLAATEREADAARVRAKLRAAKLSTKSNATNAATAEMLNSSVESTNAPLENPKKRKATKPTGRRASRRRSTLSPWELESLMAGGVESPIKETAAA